MCYIYTKNLSKETLYIGRQGANMKLKISVKQPGNKHPLIDSKVIEIADIGLHPTVYELITAVVAQQVNEYNNREAGTNLLPFLSKEKNRVVPADAQQTAIQAFEDGIFVLFVDDEEYTQTTAIVNLTSDSIITFIRLTFLSGN